ncbi:hypothetical protein [Bacillus subtilis]|uniref:hypothetical protein n=1 Tax=Bacillus subtilis TaxID=1423 RepID=UPI002DB6C119|nr:hypothetical protein [Bacillus subtilis]MEC2335224.1 hypothetical protein [Bacillus subtilis]
MYNVDPLFFIEHCTSCGMNINSHMEKGVEFYVENDGTEDYYICKSCKEKWGKVEGE